MDNLARCQGLNNVITVDFRRNDEENGSPIQLQTPGQAYRLGFATEELDEFNHLVDPDLLVLMDEPELAWLIEGALATLETGEQHLDDQILPLKATVLNFRGVRMPAISENLDNKTCAYFRGADWKILLEHAKAYIEGR